MNIKAIIHFEPLNKSHFDLMLRWFNKPHVQAFYSLRSWTFEDIEKKLTPYIYNAADMKPYIVFSDKTPIGYIQCYPINKHPWPSQNLDNEVIQNSAGLDIFIGEEEYLNKGLGSIILDTFLNTHIWPYYQFCLVDPDTQNEISIRFFRNCGFKELQLIHTKDALERPTTLQLFIKSRE